MHMVRFRRNQELLAQTPKSLPHNFVPDTATVRKIIDAVLAEGRDMRPSYEAKRVLLAYGIPTVRTEIVRTPAEAAKKASELGFRWPSRSCRRTSRTSPTPAACACSSTPPRPSAPRPRPCSTGSARTSEGPPRGLLTVQQMAVRPGAYELLDRLRRGPDVRPDHHVRPRRGTGVEVIGDSAMAMPPLNMVLAQDLISRTRIAKQLKGYRDRPSIDHDALCMA